jgi:hypothetical protein
MRTERSYCTEIPKKGLPEVAVSVMLTICELSAVNKHREENIARWLFYDVDNL